MVKFLTAAITDRLSRTVIRVPEILNSHTSVFSPIAPSENRPILQPLNTIWSIWLPLKAPDSMVWTPQFCIFTEAICDENAFWGRLVRLTFWNDNYNNKQPLESGLEEALKRYNSLDEKES